MLNVIALFILIPAGEAAATPFTVDGSTVYVSGGQVGIATSNPQTTLDVNGSAQFGSGASKSTFTIAGNLQIPYGISAATANFTSAVTASSATLSATGAGIYALTSSTGIHVLNGQIKFESGSYIQWADGSTSTAAASGGETSYFAPAKTFGSSVTVQGNAFSIGGSTLVVSGGTVTVNAAAGNGFTVVTGAYNALDMAAWASWTPTFTGFSGSPSCSAAAWKRVGTTVFIRLNGCGGTSNATTFTITNLPYTVVAAGGANQFSASGICHDNGSISVNPCAVDFGSNSKTLSMFLNASIAPFTASGAKDVYGNFFYEAVP